MLKQSKSKIPFTSLLFSASKFCIWRHGGSNPGHPACKAGALPTELYPRKIIHSIFVDQKRISIILKKVNSFEAFSQQKLDCTFSSKPTENLRFHDELSLTRILSHLISEEMS